MERGGLRARAERPVQLHHAAFGVVRVEQLVDGLRAFAVAQVVPAGSTHGQRDAARVARGDGNRAICTDRDLANAAVAAEARGGVEAHGGLGGVRFERHGVDGETLAVVAEGLVGAALGVTEARERIAATDE